MIDAWRIWLKDLRGNHAWLHAFDRARQLDEEVNFSRAVIAWSDHAADALVRMSKPLAQQAAKVERLCNEAAAQTWGRYWRGGWAR